MYFQHETPTQDIDKCFTNIDDHVLAAKDLEDCTKISNNSFGQIGTIQHKSFAILIPIWGDHRLWWYGP